eukprot:CAMPEP_0117669090 /NCGR_PEP_ID=MMETSP0804-20121206/11923_1 /TAXON_ID=1074897 /ORGANISM="Tetraselmis astigmatica, Strain CCMP880" /LENGTH=171 /DNA_ID=CAMNT_0005477077 /DNA_START=568 /DNA_END=1084 /DNA_ORIENTATION=+
MAQQAGALKLAAQGAILRVLQLTAAAFAGYRSVGGARLRTLLEEDHLGGVDHVRLYARDIRYAGQIRHSNHIVVGAPTDLKAGVSSVIFRAFAAESHGICAIDAEEVDGDVPPGARASRARKKEAGLRAGESLHPGFFSHNATLRIPIHCCSKSFDSSKCRVCRAVAAESE